MPDYGHSKGYGLLPNFCPETDPLQDKTLSVSTRQEREAEELKQQKKREKEAKCEFLLLNKAINSFKIDYKNREKYDIQLL